VPEDKGSANNAPDDPLLQIHGAWFACFTHCHPFGPNNYEYTGVIERMGVARFVTAIAFVALFSRV
jgi:hypothetical protein